MIQEFAGFSVDDNDGEQDPGGGWECAHSYHDRVQRLGDHKHGKQDDQIGMNMRSAKSKNTMKDKILVS